MNLKKLRGNFDFDFLQPCEALKTLALDADYANAKLRDCPFIEGLESLSLSSEVSNLQPNFLYKCESLKYLELPEASSMLCNQLIQAPFLSKLKYLNLRDSFVENLTFLKGCSSLEELNLSSCGWLKSASGLEGCVQLKSLYLDRTSNNAILEKVLEKTCGDLEFLSLVKCIRLQDLDILSELACISKLKILDLSHCYYLSQVDALKEAQQLETIDLSHCTQLKSFLKPHNRLALRKKSDSLADSILTIVRKWKDSLTLKAFPNCAIYP